MGRKIGLLVAGKRFDVDLEDEFASFLQLQMAKDFNVDGNNDVKSLLYAYVRKNYELFSQEKEIKEILQKLEN